MKESKRIATELLDSINVDKQIEVYTSLLEATNESLVLSKEDWSKDYSQLAVELNYAEFVYGNNSSKRLLFKTALAKREYVQRRRETIKFMHVQSVLYYLTNPTKIVELLSKIIDDSVWSKPTPAYALCKTPSQGDILEFLAIRKLIVKTTRGKKKIPYYSLREKLGNEDIVLVIEEQLSRKAQPRTKEISLRQLRNIRKYGERSLDERSKSVFGVEVSVRLLSLHNKPVRLAESLYNDDVEFNRVVDSLASRNSGDDTYSIVRKYYEELLLGLRFIDFYIDYGIDFSGRMYPTKVISPVNKEIRRHLELGDTYHFDDKSKVVAVTKLYTLLIENGLSGRYTKYRTIEEVGNDYDKLFKLVVNADYSSLKPDDRFPALRLVESLKNNDLMVSHIVGLDATNQGSQLISIMTADSRLFKYCGEDLTKTAYKAVATNFKRNYLKLVDAKDRDYCSDVLDVIITGTSMKYRFMTVPYNQSPWSTVIGNKHSQYKIYKKWVEATNETLVPFERGEEWEVNIPTVMKWITRAVIDEGVDSDGDPFYVYIDSNNELPLKSLLGRYGVSYTYIEDEDLVNAFIESVNEVSTVLYKFSHSYRKGLYTKANKLVKYMTYKSVDGYDVLLPKKALRETVMKYYSLSTEHQLTKFTAYNSFTNESELSGSPRYIQSLDSTLARKVGAVVTIHDEYFFTLDEVEEKLELYDDLLIDLVFNSNHCEQHLIEAGGKSVNISGLGDCMLTEAIIRKAKYKLWF